MSASPSSSRRRGHRQWSVSGCAPLRRSTFMWSPRCARRSSVSSSAWTPSSVRVSKPAVTTPQGTTTMCLVPQVVDAVSVPVIAAGGIADGRGMAAALALGASAVQVGTRFAVCAESSAHQAYQQAVIDAGDPRHRAGAFACDAGAVDQTPLRSERSRQSVRALRSRSSRSCSGKGAARSDLLWGRRRG